MPYQIEKYLCLQHMNDSMHGFEHVPHFVNRVEKRVYIIQSAYVWQLKSTKMSRRQSPYLNNLAAVINCL